VPLYDALASTYDEHFAVPHQRAYDDLAPLLPDAAARIVNVGCGVGRWARRLVGLGHFVLTSRRDRQMAVECRLAASALLADAGKHLYAWGRVPSSGRVVDGDPVDLDVLGARRPGRTS
jgi:SAM-dependent methyltransferase